MKKKLKGFKTSPNFLSFLLSYRRIRAETNMNNNSVGGLVVKLAVAIGQPRVRFPVDAHLCFLITKNKNFLSITLSLYKTAKNPLSSRLVLCTHVMLLCTAYAALFYKNKKNLRRPPYARIWAALAKNITHTHTHKNKKKSPAKMAVLMMMKNDDEGGEK